MGTRRPLDPPPHTGFYNWGDSSRELKFYKINLNFKCYFKFKNLNSLVAIDREGGVEHRVIANLSDSECVVVSQLSKICVANIITC